MTSRKISGGAMRSSLVMAAAAAVAAIAIAPPVQAQPRRDVEATFQAGVDAFRLGKYDEARVLLERARAMQPSLPGPHRFLAAVARAERRWDDCVASAREAMRLKPDSTEIAATREIHDACRVGLGRPAFAGSYGDGGALAVTANVVGATIAVGGLRYGATPLAPRALAAGSVEVVVDKPGWTPAAIRVEILPQVVTDVDFTLEPAPVAEALATGVDPTTHGWLVLGVSPAAAAAATVTVTIDGAHGELVPEIALAGGVHEVIVEAPGRERWRRRVRITRGQRARIAVPLRAIGELAGRRRTAMYVIGGAGAFAAVGLGAAVLSNRAAEEARDLWRIETSRPPAVPIAQTAAIEPVRTREDLAEARSRARAWGYASLASYGLAIAGGAVGAYLLLRARTEEVADRPPPFAVAPLVGGGRVGAVVELAW